MATAAAASALPAGMRVIDVHSCPINTLPMKGALAECMAASAYVMRRESDGAYCVDQSKCGEVLDTPESRRAQREDQHVAMRELVTRLLPKVFAKNLRRGSLFILNNLLIPLVPLSHASRLLQGMPPFAGVAIAVRNARGMEELFGLPLEGSLQQPRMSDTELAHAQWFRLFPAIRDDGSQSMESVLESSKHLAYPQQRFVRDAAMAAFDSLEYWQAVARPLASQQPVEHFYVRLFRLLGMLPSVGADGKPAAAWRGEEDYRACADATAEYVRAAMSLSSASDGADSAAARSRSAISTLLRAAKDTRDPRQAFYAITDAKEEGVVDPFYNAGDYIAVMLAAAAEGAAALETPRRLPAQRSTAKMREAQYTWCAERVLGWQLGEWTGRATFATTLQQLDFVRAQTTPPSSVAVAAAVPWSKWPLPPSQMLSLDTGLDAEIKAYTQNYNLRMAAPKYIEAMERVLRTRKRLEGRLRKGEALGSGPLGRQHRLTAEELPTASLRDLSAAITNEAMECMEKTLLHPGIGGRDLCNAAPGCVAVDSGRHRTGASGGNAAENAEYLCLPKTLAEEGFQRDQRGLAVLEQEEPGELAQWLGDIYRYTRERVAPRLAAVDSVLGRRK